MTESDLLQALDKYTRKYFEAQCTLIFEYNTRIQHDQEKVIRETNRDREAMGLPPIPRPDHWLPEEDD